MEVVHLILIVGLLVMVVQDLVRIQLINTLADGTYTATVTVTDNKGSTDTDTASVTISTPAFSC